MKQVTPQLFTAECGQCREPLGWGDSPRARIQGMLPEELTQVLAKQGHQRKNVFKNYI